MVVETGNYLAPLMVEEMVDEKDMKMADLKVSLMDYL